MQTLNAPAFRSITPGQIESKTYADWQAADQSTRLSWSRRMEETYTDALPGFLSFPLVGQLTKTEKAGGINQLVAVNGGRYSLMLRRDRGGYHRCPQTGLPIFWLTSQTGKFSRFCVHVGAGIMQEVTA